MNRFRRALEKREEKYRKEFTSGPPLEAIAPLKRPPTMQEEIRRYVALQIAGQLEDQEPVVAYQLADFNDDIPDEERVLSEYQLAALAEELEAAEGEMPPEPEPEPPGPPPAADPAADPPAPPVVDPNPA